ncbi:MAG TPA: ammonia channel protein [Acidimicrobiaceae bacterium]|jgi:Amt family ammonium transporter|nr:ammonia channel protein [Acidimicrobiaceae bacterium]MCH2632461.1 ammonium transporter [Acidimicrobiales bacterium]OUW33029.1 MAG: ammonia channel protein [Actinobacteria bacterium TMED172]HAA65339.1 ammonia channel protein [Acidimicrobiaceae bacterium]HAY64459.1 ammonia channel protein [Acidimicrobiaceae bacterium]|tara:strand:- start:90 stop:1292 length:1203 start_codon:yes stop_codon:yes gene_type:complete
MEGNIAWILTSAALVLFMIPGLALFYGGMVRAKNALNMLNMNMWCLGIVPVVWVLVGLSLSAGESGRSWLGDLSLVGLKGMSDPMDIALFAFGMTFACITPALISGAVADRMKFSAWMIFVPIWTLVVYCPVVYWVYGADGWIINLPAHDFAGGTAIHVNAGAAALALAIVLGKRSGWPQNRPAPHNVPFVMLGAGILWFGWFGFNAGSAFAADGLAAQAFLNTFIAGAAGMVAWMITEMAKTGKVSTIGMASGVIAALVAITPAAGFVGSMHSFVFGALAGVICFFAIEAKYRFGFDDSLDVVGIHLVGGVVGGVLLGFMADASAVPGGDFVNGVFFGGGILLWNQILSIVVVMAFSFVATFVIAKVLDSTIGLRVSESTEMTGLDVSDHGEAAYVMDA